MKKDPDKLCTICYKMRSYSYEIDSNDNYIMEVECAEFPRSGWIIAKDMDMTCIGYIPIVSVTMPKRDPFIAEDEMRL